MTIIALKVAAFLFGLWTAHHAFNDVERLGVGAWRRIRSIGVGARVFTPDTAGSYVIRRWVGLRRLRRGGGWMLGLTVLKREDGA